MTKAEKAPKMKKPLTFFNLPWPIFLIITVITLLVTYLGVLPAGMAGCFLFMMVLGEILSWIGDHTPIIKSYLGGGAIVCIFGAGLLVFANLIPAYNAPKAKENYYTPAVAQVISAIDESVDEIVVKKKQDLLDGKISPDETFIVEHTLEKKKDGELDGIKLTSTITVSVDKEKKTVTVKTLDVNTEQLPDEIREFLTSPSYNYLVRYVGKQKSEKKDNPISSLVSATNSVVDGILSDTKLEWKPDQPIKKTVLGYKNKPMTVSVTLDKDRAVKSVKIDAPELPEDAQDAIDYASGTKLTDQYIGKKGWNMILPFGFLDLVGNIGKFFKTEGGFLDWYIAALITGSILGMNRKLLMKAAARYFPAIFGGLILAFALCCGVAAIMGYPVMNALLLIALPIMGGGMGAGATPLSKIFESSSSMSAAQALSVMTPAVAIGNAISIVLAGVLIKVIKGKLNGNGQLMQSGTVDPKELEISPEMQQKRDSISLKSLGIGLLVSGAFFAWGFILAGIWKSLVPSITIHAYAWMIITVAICKITNIVPEKIEIACYQWFQFIMKNLTPMLLIGIGICYLDISTVISSFSVTYLLLCLATCVGAFVGAALIGKLVGFYPFESGITAGLCMSNMGGTGDVAVLSSAKRMELMPFAQISSRLGGAVILLLASLMLSVLAQFIVPM